MIIKINNEQNKGKISEILRDIFPKLTKDYIDNLSNLDSFYLQFNNKIVFDKVKDRLKQHNIELSIVQNVSNLNKVGSVIYPLSSNSQIYGVIVFFRDEHHNKEKSSDLLSIERNDISNLEFHSTNFCKGCRKNIPQKINFCIFCGTQVNFVEQVQNYSIKITSINNQSSISILLKYLSNISEKLSHLQLLEYLSKIPVIINFLSTEYNLNKLLYFLDELGISYKLYPPNFSFDKLISGITNEQVYLGLIKFEDYLFDPNVSELAKETIKSIKYPEIKDILTKTLIEAYKVLEVLNEPETSNEYVFKEIKKELNNLIFKFLKLISRYNKLKDYLNSNHTQKLKDEINFIFEQSKNIDNSLESSYTQIIKIKKEELENVEQIENNVLVLESEILSTISSLRMLRSKILNVNIHDIHGKKGDMKEIKDLKESIILKVHSMEEVLKL